MALHPDLTARFAHLHLQLASGFDTAQRVVLLTDRSVMIEQKFERHWFDSGRAFLLCLVVLLASLPRPAVHADEAKGAERKTIVVLGDSIAAGFGLEPDEAFPALLQQKIEASKLPFHVINAGLSGDTTAGGLRRIDWLLRRKIDVLLIELGGNDGLRGISATETRKNLEAIIERARKKYPEIKIVLGGMQMPPNMGEEYTAEYKKIFPEVAKARKTELIPFVLEGVGGSVELNQPDRIHPTAAGQKIIADNVWKILEPLLRKTE
ncbi:MAG: arylesterase [Verrucomicrobiota bacterium]